MSFIVSCRLGSNIFIISVYSTISKSFLLFSGPYVGVAAIIFSGDKFLCDSLTPLLPLFYLHHYRKFMDHLAQTFCAFKKALNALDSYYTDPPKIFPSQLEFPYINSFTL